jgi:hypothetical protein
LFGHGAADFGDTVADTDDGSLAGGIEIAAPVGVYDPTTFAADRYGILFAKVARKQGRGINGRGHTRIVTKKSSRRRDGIETVPCDNHSQVRRKMIHEPFFREMD